MGSEPCQQAAREGDVILQATADWKSVVSLPSIEVADLHAEADWYSPDAKDCGGINAAAKLQRAGAGRGLQTTGTSRFRITCIATAEQKPRRVAPSG